MVYGGMAKASIQYICQNCGAVYPRWQGQCDSCKAWNTIQDEPAPQAPPLGKGIAAGARKRVGSSLIFHNLNGAGDRDSDPEKPRLVSGITELDRVLGGGLADGQAVLIGGDPGIGKSTLLLEAAALLSRQARCLYISGEEAISQIRLRAHRLGVENAQVELASAANVQDIQASILQSRLAGNGTQAGGGPVVVIDSIQTMYVGGVDAAPGTVTQVRLSAQELIRTAKDTGAAVLLVGHVTKDGAIAGPRVLEHMVDTVLYFEGERAHPYRILRAVKNRYGPTDEIGVFDMTGSGLKEVPNPSALFLSDRQDGIAGAAVFAGMEGSRPLLVEVQGLIAQSPLATPRRAVVGWDNNRLSMLLAVLETRAGLSLAGRDVYLNIAGGLRISEPAADLAVAAALVSSALNQPIPEDSIFFGEIALSGQVRPVARIDGRLKEAQKLGFSQAIGPPRRQEGRQATSSGKNEAMSYHEIRDVTDLTEFLRSAL